MSTPPSPYSPVKQAGDWVVVSGQIAFVDGAIVSGGLQAETPIVMDNLKARLAEAGATLQDIVKTTVFLTDMDDFAAFNEIYIAKMDGARPARSCIAVAGLPYGATVEVEAWAYLGQ